MESKNSVLVRSEQLRKRKNDLLVVVLHFLELFKCQFILFSLIGLIKKTRVRATKITNSFHDISQHECDKQNFSEVVAASLVDAFGGTST